MQSHLKDATDEITRSETPNYGIGRCIENNDTKAGHFQTGGVCVL